LVARLAEALQCGRADHLGNNDLACEQLGAAIRRPGSISYGELKLLPFSNPLRGDPCFERIVASLAPK
jgi:hypothetical protein